MVRRGRSTSASSYLSSDLQTDLRALDEEPEDRPDQLSLESSDCLAPGLPIGLDPAGDVSLGRRMEAGLGHGNHVHSPVELAVAAPVEPHPLDLPGAGRCGADPGQLRAGPADAAQPGRQPPAQPGYARDCRDPIPLPSSCQGLRHPPDRGRWEDLARGNQSSQATAGPAGLQAPRRGRGGPFGGRLTDRSLQMLTDLAAPWSILSVTSPAVAPG